jgi:MFS family permease
MLVAAGVYVLSSLVATTMHARALGPDPDVDRPETADAVRNVVRGFVDGARHVWRHRPAGYALASITAHRFFYGLSTIATVLLYRNYFTANTDDDGLGGLALVVGSAGVGFLTAAVVTPPATRRVGKETWMVALFAAAAVSEAAFGTPFTKPSLVIAAFLLGIVAQGVKICVDTLVQEQCDDAFRGRVFSLYDVLFNVAFVSAAAVGVVLLPTSGKSYVSIGLIAGGYAVTGAVYAYTVRRLRASSETELVTAGAVVAPRM